MNREKLKAIFEELKPIQRDRKNNERILPISVLVDVLEAILEEEK